MDNRSLALALALAMLAIAALGAVMALYRRERALTIYALGFLAGAAGFILYLGQGRLSPWISVVAANTLTMANSACLAWGARTHAGRPRPWPRRFWAYEAAWTASLAFLSLAPGSFQARAVLASSFAILFAAEFLAAHRRGEPGLPKPVLNGMRWLCLGYCAAHLSRVAMILAPGQRGGYFMDGNAVTAWTLSFTLFFSILWAGAILVLDGVRILGRLEEKSELLRTMAMTDELTGLSNRHLLDQRILSESGRADRYGQPLSVILFDLDNFKLVNDTWGHDAGDKVLVRAADVAQERIRAPDTLVRWGGEEFMILAPQTDVRGAASLAEKLRAAMASEDFPGAGRVTASFGVAERAPGESREAWFRRVDHALYRAKNEGRDRVVSWGREQALPVATVRLEWREDWESGNALVDSQHKALVELSNDLLDLSLSATPGEALPESLDRLLDHVARHFADEERILLEVGYPDARAHAELHRSLVEEALGLKASFARGELQPAALFSFLVGQVVMGHLISADSQFFPWTRGSAVS